MGEQLARQINAVTYLKCSCNEQKGMENIFEEAVWASLRILEQERQSQHNSFIRNSTKHKRSFFRRIFKR